MAYRLTPLLEKLPDVMATVSTSKSACENTPVGGLTNIMFIKPLVLRVPVNRMILVASLTVQAGFRWLQIVIALYHLAVRNVAG